MSIYQASGVKRFLLALSIAAGTYCGVATAQPLDDVGLEYQDQGIVATIRLTGPVQYLRHFPESQARRWRSLRPRRARPAPRLGGQ